MQKVFDFIAIFSGIIGMGSLLLMLGDLTAETAALHSARAILVMALVFVPFLVARAIEKFNLNFLAKCIMPQRTPQPQPPVPTSYFDYLFQPGSANDWHSNRIAKLRSNRNASDARDVEM